jgi:hypothetical protein
MSQSIYRGICRGGPLDGKVHMQITKPPTIAGCFDYENLATGQSGSYTYLLSRAEWRWCDDPIKREGEPIGAG